MTPPQQGPLLKRGSLILSRSDWTISSPAPRNEEKKQMREKNSAVRARAEKGASQPPLPEVRAGRRTSWKAGDNGYAGCAATPRQF